MFNNSREKGKEPMTYSRKKHSNKKKGNNPQFVYAFRLLFNIFSLNVFCIIFFDFALFLIFTFDFLLFSLFLGSVFGKAFLFVGFSSSLLAR